MIGRLVNVPAVIWSALVVMTLLSVAIVERSLMGSYSVLIIVLIAALKSRLVILHYMEAKRAPAHWRFLYESWNFSATATVIIGHYMAVTRVVY